MQLIFMRRGQCSICPGACTAWQDIAHPQCKTGSISVAASYSCRPHVLDAVSVSRLQTCALEVLEHVLNGIRGELRHLLCVQATLKPELDSLQIRAAECRSKHLQQSSFQYSSCCIMLQRLISSHVCMADALQAKSTLAFSAAVSSLHSCKRQPLVWTQELQVGRCRLTMRGHIEFGDVQTQL